MFKGRDINKKIDDLGINIYEYGAKGNAFYYNNGKYYEDSKFTILANDDIAAIEAALEVANQSKIRKRVRITDGIFTISRTIVIPRGVHLELSRNAIIKPLGDFNIFQLKPECALEGGIIDLREFNFTKAAIYANAVDIFQLYEQTHIVSNMNIKGKPMNQDWKGTAILLEANTLDSYIDNLKFNDITITNLGKGIHLRVDPSITDVNRPSWVNANYFHQITMQNFEYGIYLEGLNTVPRDVGGNMFNQVQLQAEAGTKRMIYCEGAYNRFDIFAWDLHKMLKTNPAFEFPAVSKFNSVTSAMTQEITESWLDKGYLNVLYSPGNYTADKRIQSHPISMPYEPNFLGNQDDYLVNGNLRGYTVTQTSTHPKLTGELIDLLSPDTENGVTWDGTNATYENPIVIEIDTTSDPIWYAQFLTCMSAWGMFPQSYEMELFNGLDNKWYGSHWIKNNKSQSVTVSPPWAGADKCTKIRIKFWESNKSDKKIGISRVMITSGSSGGKFYMPSFGGDFTGDVRMKTNETGIFFRNATGTEKKLYLLPDGTLSIPPATPDLPTRLPNDKTMIGEQDDILLNADKRYVVTSTGAVKSAGNIWGMFSLRREQFCKWTAPTLAAPIVLELDFTAKPLKYMESIGIAFGNNEIPTNIKVERILASGGAYVQLLNLTNNKDSIIHIASRSANTYKIKLTIYGADTRINRIFGTTGDDYPVAFVNTESDNTIYGDLEFGDLAKGVIMKSADGSRWRVTIDNTGVLKSTKL